MIIKRGISSVQYVSTCGDFPTFIQQLPDVTAGGSRGAVSLVKAYLLQGNMTRAKEVYRSTEYIAPLSSVDCLGGVVANGCIG